MSHDEIRATPFQAFDGREGAAREMDAIELAPGVETSALFSPDRRIAAS